MPNKATKITDQKYEQRVRLRRFLLAMSAYVFNYSAAIIISIIHVDNTPVGFWWKSLLIAVIINLSFIVVFKSGRNNKFVDPSLTSLQIIVSAIWGCYILHALPLSRPIVLLFFIPAFCFGMLRLKTRQYQITGLWVLAFYASVLGYEYLYRTDFNLHYELYLFTLFSALLFWLAWFGGMVSRIRSQLHMKTKQLEAANQMITEQSITDDLTRVYNRKHAISVLKHVIGIAERFELRFSVAIIDIDHFKKINDQYGHLIGDEVLRVFAQRAAEAIRLSDMMISTVWHESDAHKVEPVLGESGFLARYGGEEFLVLLPGTPLVDAKAALERIQKLVSGESFYVPFPLAVTFSAGIAEYQKGESVESLLHRADMAMYYAKHGGRNRIEIKATQ